MAKEIERLQSVSAVAINKTGKILELHRSPAKKYNPDQWNVVAGKLEVGKVPEVAILEEVLQETGRKASILMPPVVWHIYQPDHEVLFEDHAFLVTLESEEIQLNEEHIEYDWSDPFAESENVMVPFFYENLHMVGITRSREPYKILYTNWKGETEWQIIAPRRYYFGTTEYHKTEQWLLEAYNPVKDAMRTYAVADIHLLIPPIYRGEE